MEKKFKCKDEVIYRRTDEKSEWTYGIFSHYYDYNNVKGVVVDGHFLLSTVHSVLPYEGNEHLVGTTDEPDEEVRLEKGEWIMCSMIWHELIRGYCHSRKFVRTGTSQFICSEDTEDGKVEHICNYAIRFKDFDPSNMEETRKHILVVKNGKVVRYRG